jgi:ZIP family zinc transporter/zinc and cadmium transporter
VVLFTIIAFYILEHTIGIHTCREGECDVHSIGILAFAGITIHSLIDGIVIGIGFEADVKIGLASTIAILLHKLPVGISVTAIFLHSGFERRKTVVRAWIVALATPVGALVSYFFIQSVEESLLGLLLAFSAGSLIYVGASDLLPETHKNFKRSNILLVLIGVSLVYFVSYIVGGH